MAPRPEVAKWGLTRRQGWRHSRVKWPRSDGDPTGSDSRLATRRPPLSPPSGMPTLIPALRTSFEFRATRRRARRGSRSFSVWPAGALPEPAPTLTPNWTATSAAATTDLAPGFGVKGRADVDYLRGRADRTVIGTQTIRLVEESGVGAVKPLIESLPAPA